MGLEKIKFRPLLIACDQNNRISIYVSKNKNPPLTALHLDMKDAAKEDEDDQDDTDDNRESVSLVKDEVLLVAHSSFSMYFNLPV